MEAGKIHGAMLSAPTSLRAKKLGYTMLADLQMLGLEYQHTSIATSRALIKSNPNLVLDFMRAYSEGIHFAKTHRRETINILTKYLRTDDMEILDDTYESIIRTLVPEKPYPTEKGIQIILREFGLKDAAARSAKPEQFIDLTFIKELDNSGFIDRLYKTSPVAQAAPRTHPVPAPVAIKEKIPAAEKPVKTAVLDERSRPVAKQQPEPTEKPATVQITPKPVSAGAREYTVRAGDTLSKLAERFYNSTSKWAIIYEANKETVKNPNYIYVGMKITIPAEDQTS
jgi:LysM repeat protein